MLQDIAILTGGQVVSEEVGLKLENVTTELLGRARKVVVTKDDTTIIEGAGSHDDVAGRINQIKAEIENTDSSWDKEKLQERLAKLSGGVSVIKVGAATEVELKEKKHRIEDAVSATRAAVEEGIVPGGGVTLIRAEGALDKLDLEGDEATGAKIVRDALAEPARRIAQNAGYEGAVIVLAGPHRGRRPRLRRRDRRVGRHDEGRHHRPGQGDPLGAAERRVDRGHRADGRVRRRREAGGRGARAPAATGTRTRTRKLRAARGTAEAGSSGARLGPSLVAGPRTSRVACSRSACGAGTVRSSSLTSTAHRHVVLVGVHSTVLGPAMGGTRMKTYPEPGRRRRATPAAVAGDDVQERRRRASVRRWQGRARRARRPPRGSEERRALFERYADLRRVAPRHLRHRVRHEHRARPRWT